jgi:hypothetical protein
VCIKRGAQDTCRKERVIVNGKVFNEGPKDHFVDQLESDLEKIQFELQEVKKENEYLKSKVTNLENPKMENAQPKKISEYGYFGTTVGLLTRFTPPLDDKVQYDFEAFERLGKLLTPTVSRQLIDFNLENLYFLHCVILPEIFLKEHDEFFKLANVFVGNNFDKTRSQYLWLSTYYALIANLLLLLDQKIAETMYLLEAELTLLGKIAFLCSLECLNRGQYLLYPNIRSIQTFAVLATSVYFFGVDLQNSMFASMLYISKCLNLDKLIKPSADLDLLNFEISCRVWWLLVALDWFEDTSLNKNGAIKVGSFSTPKPRNISDYNLIHGIEEETEEFLPITFNIIMYDIARLKKLYYFNNKIVGISSTLENLDYAYMNILSLEKYFHSFGDQPNNQRFAEYLLDIKLRHEKLVIKRSIINIKYNNDEDISEEISVCYNSSIELIDLYNKTNYPDYFKKYWFAIEHSGNGAIFLLINNIMDEKSIKLRTINSIEQYVKTLNEVVLPENNPLVSGTVIINKLIETIKQRLNNEQYRLDIDEIDEVLTVLNDFQIIYPTEKPPFEDDKYWSEFFSWME